VPNGARLAAIRSRQAALRSLELADVFKEYVAFEQAAVSALSGSDATDFATALARTRAAAAKAQTSASALAR
jgi:hypothetical protein